MVACERVRLTLSVEEDEIGSRQPFKARRDHVQAALLVLLARPQRIRTPRRNAHARSVLVRRDRAQRALPFAGRLQPQDV